MNHLDINKKIKKLIRSKSKASKTRYNNIVEELRFQDHEGQYYTKYNGEDLLEEAKSRKVTNCIPYSVEIENRLRLVYEVYPGMVIDEVNYDKIIIVTDLDNHKWRGKPYAKIFSE